MTQQSRPLQLIWFKRDLRLFDHQALTLAVQRGPILPLYILEPNLWQLPDLSDRQYRFLTDSLQELRGALENLGAHLVIKVGDARDVLDHLHKEFCFETLWSHQETWNGWTYQRDQQVQKWCVDKGVSWIQPRQHGVFRGLKDRSQWRQLWYHEMSQPCLPTPKPLNGPFFCSDPLPDPKMLGLENDGLLYRQMGGRQQGIALLYSFLRQRGKGYTKEMSSPLTAFESCSRLSPHIAFGTLSIREIFQAAQQRSRYLRTLPKDQQATWPSSMLSFTNRLRWHCHFIQKLEDEPQIECRALHPLYEDLRKQSFNPAYYAAWQTGQTGYPLIDACMRSLRATGWLNFRMRAMVMSFASYHLWLDWRHTAPYLASLFVDYEPGIHYSQVQMQSGTTGINTLRIYNPIKQSMEQDPMGVFIKKWVVELREVPAALIHTPWKQQPPPDNYPLPIVEEKAARINAATILYGLRKDTEHHQSVGAILKKHVG